MAVSLKATKVGTAPGAGIINDVPKEATHLNTIVNDLANTRWRLMMIDNALNEFRSRTVGEGKPTSGGEAGKAGPSQPHIQEIGAIQVDIFELLNSLENHVSGINNLG